MLPLNPRPVRLSILDNFLIDIEFNNGEKRVFDVKPYLKDKFYSSLMNKNMFKTAKLNGITIEWANGIDFCPDEIYVNSK